jgi:hypothetical protein
MNAIFEAALEVEQAMRQAGFRFCIIGGLAVQRWGRPRMTADVDLTLVTGFGTEAPYVDALLVQFRGRVQDAREFALRHRTLLLAAKNGVHVDVSLGAMPFEERAVLRATPFSVGGPVPLTVCSAEDLVVHKAFAGREKDWLDIVGIIERQGERLDVALVFDELVPLLELKQDVETAPRLRALLHRR